MNSINIYETIEQQIVDRYVVEKRNSGFWPYCVRAVGGTQEIFIGHKNSCDVVRQALQTACLDGAYMAEIAYRQQEPDAGHRLKEVRRGVWLCYCGKQITEGDIQCTNGTPSTLQQQQGADCLAGTRTPADGSAEHQERGGFIRADGSRSSVTGSGSPGDPLKADNLSDLVEGVFSPIWAAIDTRRISRAP